MRPELQSVTLVQLLSDRSILAAKNDPAFTADITQGAHPLIVQRASYVENALNSAKATGKSNRLVKIEVLASPRSAPPQPPYSLLRPNPVQEIWPLLVSEQSRLMRHYLSTAVRWKPRLRS
jgi:hypothetical protein